MLREEAVPEIYLPPTSQPQLVAHNGQLRSMRPQLPCLRLGQLQGIMYTLELSCGTLFGLFPYVALFPLLPYLIPPGSLACESTLQGLL